MQLYDHQIEISQIIQQKLSSLNLAIVNLPERSGKTLTVIDAIIKSNFKSPLWVTKKAAISGVEKDAKSYGSEIFTVTNYEMLHKTNGKFDVVIYDEFHQLSTYPKPNNRVKELRKFSGLPTVLISATPSAESSSQWFYPLWLTSHPFSMFANFYAWSKKYVNVTQKRAGMHLVNDYSNGKDELILPEIVPYIIKRSRDELGFEHHPTVEVHTVPLHVSTKESINTLKRNRVLGDYIADTPTKLINAIYQLECGTLKDGDKYKDMGNREMIDYIKATWGDTQDVAIMTHWIGQRETFEKEFSNALILSSTSHAEGIDLAHVDHLVIASMDYSTARFQQRNARQAAKHRTKPITVHVLTTDCGISRKVYEAVAVKHCNFTARMLSA